MFSRKDTDANVRFVEEKLDSIVSSDVRIEGKFISKGNIRLDCTIIGDVFSESIFIGELGNVKGNIICNNIMVAGKIDGNVECRSKMHIKETGNINGDIRVNVLSMDAGAVFTGSCTKLKEDEIKSLTVEEQ